MRSAVSAGGAAPSSKVSRERVMELLTYDPETGLFRWKVTRPNARAGEIAGGLSDQGYWRVCVDGRKYRANRLAYLIMVGVWPTHEVDHRNGMRDDNRWTNLRHATRGQNEANKPATGLIGLRGVRRMGNRYEARIRINGQRTHLGSFATEREASDAYMKAASASYGEFARSR